QIFLCPASGPSGRHGVMKQRWSNRIELRCSLGHRDVRLEPTHNAQPPNVRHIEHAAVAVDCCRVNRCLSANGKGDIEAASNNHSVEACRSDADDFQRMAVQAQLASDDAGIAAVLPLPERIADHSSWQPTAAIVVGPSEDASQNRLHTQSVESVSAHPKAICVAYLASRGKIELIRAPGKKIGKDLLA